MLGSDAPRPSPSTKAAPIMAPWVVTSGMTAKAAVASRSESTIMCHSSTTLRRNGVTKRTMNVAAAKLPSTQPISEGVSPTPAA